MSKAKVKSRVTVLVNEDEVAKLSAQALLGDGLEPRSGSDFSEYEKAVYLANQKIKGHGPVKLVRQHHRWTGPRGITRQWRFIFQEV